MTISVTVTADGGEAGLDPAPLCNEVLEPLIEAGGAVEEERH